MTDVDWDPDGYLDAMLAEIPSYVELQDQVAAATAGLDVSRALELGVGTGETARRVLALHPERLVDGDRRQRGDARSRAGEAPRRRPAARAASRIRFPTGPFDLVGVVAGRASPGRAGQAGPLPPRLRCRRSVFVLGDVVVPEDPADAQIEIDWVVDLPDRLDDQLEWLRAAGFEAEPTWSYKDLAVVRASRPQPR